MKIYELPFYAEMFRTFEAMQYSVSDSAECFLKGEEENNQCKENEGWLNKIKPKAFEAVQAFEKFVKEELKNPVVHGVFFDSLRKNPLIWGLIGLCYEACEAKTRDEFKEVYERYIRIQKEHKFEGHKEDYIDAGCDVTIDGNGQLQLEYPLFLYGAYVEHGGIDDDYRGGYLLAKHNLTVDEVKELFEIARPLFYKNQKIFDAYKNMVNSPENNG